MKFRGLIVAAVVLLGLAGLLYWSQRHKPADTAQTPASPAILKLDPATITGITIRNKGSAPVVLAKSAAGPWQITEPTPAEADADAVSGLIATLTPLSSERIVEDKATNLATYGLSDPAVEVDVTTRDNKTTRLMIGDPTPTGDDVYAAVAGDPRVYTALSSAKTGLDKSFTDLRDKRLVPIEASSVKEIEVDRKGSTLAFARIPGGWRIDKPQPLRADPFPIDDLVQQVAAAKWDPSTTPAEAAKEYARAEPLATVKITGRTGDDTLDVRSDHDNDYAKSSALDATYKVDPTVANNLAQALQRRLDDYRQRQVFDFTYNDPERIEYHSGATTLVLSRSGDSWSGNNRKMDRGSVEALITALRDLTATKFADSGYTAPEMEFTVTSRHGKLVETVGLQKTPTGAIAKRSDGPTLYELDAASVTSLTNALSGVRPAGASTPAN